MRREVNFNEVISLVEVTGLIEIMYNYDMFQKIYKLPKRCKETEDYWQDVNNFWFTVDKLEISGYDQPMPVTISLDVCKINNRLVGFWETQSVIVDYNSIEKFLEKMFVNSRFYMTKSLNFHLILDYIELLNNTEGLVKNVN